MRRQIRLINGRAVTALVRTEADTNHTYSDHFGASVSARRARYICWLAMYRYDGVQLAFEYFRRPYTDVQLEAKARAARAGLNLVSR